MVEEREGVREEEEATHSMRENLRGSLADCKLAQLAIPEFHLEQGATAYYNKLICPLHSGTGDCTSSVHL